jgi:hypothetical protein
VAVSDATATFKVEAVFTDMLEPYPAEITQNEVRASALNNCVILSHSRAFAYTEAELLSNSLKLNHLFDSISVKIIFFSTQNNLELLF